jgi:subtilisin family serine protease
MNTSTLSRIFRFTFPIIALIIALLLALTHTSIVATASDDPQQPTPSGTPDDGLDPTSTPPPTIWVSPTPSPYPIITPTPTPILDITPTFTPTVTATPEPTNPPDIEISPTSFEVTLREGGISTEDLILQNVGESTLTFSITTSSTTTVPTYSLRFPATKIEAGLIEQIQASSNQQATFIVYLTTQADLNAAYQIQDWALRGDLVFHTLLETAQGTQADLISHLENQRNSGAVSSYRPFYIINAISVTAGLDTLNDLAARPDVAYIEAERVFHIPEPIPADDLSTDVVEWGVSKIRADEVWSNFDLRGEGIVVANIDTGVLHTHPALVNQYRGTTSGSHNYNWFDPRGASTPFDNNGHGTHTMGTMVGSDGGSNQIGIAPAAQWIAAKGCYSSYCTESDLLASAEWVLAPYPYGGSPSQGDPDMRPHVVNNSWGGWGGDLWYQASVIAWRAASIFPAFSAGNSGPGSGTVGSPGDYAESFASGATDSSDVIASFSSRGPSSLTNENKPDVSAPGVNVRSSYNNGDYYTASGTSMASPHTAGCVALVLSAAPNLDLTSVENLLTSTSVDLGSSGPDYTYGYGRIDCYAAVSEAGNIGVPWLTVDPGSGSVLPLEPQTISITVDASNLTTGEYGAILTIHSNDPDENPLDVPITLHVTSQEPDIEISPTDFQATLPVGGSSESNLNIANIGDATLNFELEILTSNVVPVPQGGPDGFGYAFADSDQPGGPAFDWIDISDSGNQLSLSDDSYFFPVDLPFNFNFYGTDYNQVAVASNGTIYFQDAYLGLGNTPIPSRNNYTPQTFIAVYWDDLNPSANGDIYYQILGAEPDRKLVIQYQEVAHYGTSSNTVTAQAILLEGSNSILVQYLDPSSEAGSGATEGIQGDPDPETNWGLQYGYDEAVLTANLAICYAYPEMPLDCSSSGPAPSWLSIDPTEGAVEPQASQDVIVSLDATDLNPGTYSGSITVNSNDPDENPLTVPVTLNVTASEPDIEITPTSFEVTLRLGEEAIENLAIGNVGGSDLTFELEASIADPIPNPPGGPDGFGYTFMDSNDFGGPPFNWLDISTSGTRLSLTDDSYAFPISLPFNFNFYGTDYSQVAVSSNGAIYFQNVPLSYSNLPIPTNSSSTPQMFIAVYWDDLNPSSGGAVYYQILGSEPDRKFIVQWQQVPHYGSTSDWVTAQVILLEGSNSILAQYLDPSNEAGSGATTGIQGDPSPGVNWGLQYGYNQAVLSENLTICYAYPDSYPNCVGPTASWLSVDPPSGSVRPKETRNIDVHIDASNLKLGEHLGAITVHSNDPDEDLLVVPVTLHVTAPEPDIEVSPTSFDLTLPPGKSYLENLVISNLGDANLSFQVSVDTSVPVDWQPLSFPTAKLDPELRNIDLFAANSHATFLVYLNSQANLASAFQFQDRDARGDFVFQTLQNTAQRTQAGLISYLESQRSSGAVSSYRPFYIVNAIAVTAGLDVVNDLAARPDVAYIEAEKVFHIPEPIPAEDLSIDAVEWGVSKIRADQVWSEFDIRGHGIVVANIDTGVLHTHSALVNQYRGTATGSHNYNWYDPRGASTPFDNHGHGTHTMGTMVGSDGGSNQIGVAPAAQWIAAKGCYSSSCTDTDLLASAEWVLAPYPYGGSPSDGDPNMRPHVVNNSWGGGGGDLWYQASVNAWRAAGIFPSFSAGNSGPGSGTVGSPGDYAVSFASGATDSSDIIAYFSSRGPSSLTNETKPDVSAPGVSVRSAYNDGGYTSMSGTSMASPHTAGCVALILSAAPDLDLVSVEGLLTSTSVDLGTSGPDYTYGYGRIDCYAAVSEVGSTWIRVTPTSGNIQPGGTQNLTVTFDTTGLTPGSYAANIEIRSNDPDEGLIRIPVTLIVTNYAD